MSGRNELSATKLKLFHLAFHVSVLSNVVADNVHFLTGASLDITVLSFLIHHTRSNDVIKSWRFSRIYRTCFADVTAATVTCAVNAGPMSRAIRRTKISGNKSRGLAVSPVVERWVAQNKLLTSHNCEFNI